VEEWRSGGELANHLLLHSSSPLLLHFSNMEPAMPSDLEQIRAIKSQTLSRIAELTAQPKPTYDIDGQRVSWNEYLARLRATVDWCDRQLAGQEPIEIHSQGVT